MLDVIGKDVISYKEVRVRNSFVGPTLSSEVFYMLVRGRPEIVPNKSFLVAFEGTGLTLLSLQVYSYS